MNTLNKILNYKSKEPEYVLLAFNYADEYSEGVFSKGITYGIFIGVILTLLTIIILL